MQLELDVEKRLQALIAKDRIRIKEFFLDFDKLRKGTVGEAGVSKNSTLKIYRVIFESVTLNLNFMLTLNSSVLASAL